MQLTLERPDYEFFLRGADGTSALVNVRMLRHSFIVAPDALIEQWTVADASTFSPVDLESLLALKPELIVLGTGAVQVFPPLEVMAASLTRGVGIEVMANAAAARTFNVLAAEGRRVVAGFILS